ncbi:MAG: YcjX family protein [Hyphomicrobiaceae bacterium]|nr:YcjX family protein [Hyphomicrobiaceae bacterium]
MTPTVRLGVTGLSRAGKTVFITSLVRNLIVGGRLPFFQPHADGRILRAFLEPQPDDAVPRFDYERHLATLAADPPDWPAGTRRISELRITIEYEPTSYLRRLLGPARLHVDIVDYPGEWLTDLALIAQPFADWAAEALQLARSRIGHAGAPDALPASRAFIAFHDDLTAPPVPNPAAPDETVAAPDAEQTALEGARLFTAYLAEARIADGGIATLSPGRFLMPGDLEGSPLLTFFPLSPLPLAQSQTAGGGDTQTRPTLPSPGYAKLEALLQRRYESYKSHVVGPFFRNHFSRIDRQIVLVDVLGAMNGGQRAIADLERALEGVLKAFRPGQNSWLSSWLSRRVDHLLFAATKADHLHHVSHDRLEALLRLMTDRAITRATSAGAEVGVMALSALRATREAEARHKGEQLDCIVGTPLPGETIDGRVFDGKTEAAVFPGDLPADPKQALEGLASGTSDLNDMAVIRFRPPRLPLLARDGQPAAMPHIRLDRVMQFLLGDKFR